jgi:hypothetical protein
VHYVRNSQLEDQVKLAVVMHKDSAPTSICVWIIEDLHGKHLLGSDQLVSAIGVVVHLTPKDHIFILKVHAYIYLNKKHELQDL